jgi:hypothetical protein
MPGGLAGGTEEGKAAGADAAAHADRFAMAEEKLLI